MRKLTESQLATLRTVADFEHMGGTTALDYAEWRARELLRKRRLVKFEGRRRSKSWRFNFYTITEAGHRALAITGNDSKGGAV